jgi:hypothetical protein
MPFRKRARAPFAWHRCSPSDGHVALASRENQGMEVSILLPADIGAERPSAVGCTGTRCRALAVWDRDKDQPRNGRCSLHGGLSTGPRTKVQRRRHPGKQPPAFLSSNASLRAPSLALSVFSATSFEKPQFPENLASIPPFAPAR